MHKPTVALKVKIKVKYATSHFISIIICHYFVYTEAILHAKLHQSRL